ncbi:AraC family transcriptional regulator [Paenibacillus sp. LHD-117]|uniref:AraC family transcriptional regulator n=1 Tax=Paenibacillus sp. LHD-117 TaxID=3071412 RepID=UPI0027DED6C7|nr:AraC family transcriptional regulator [Paenibacillus sp. LHD-117]MDQ6418540.1 AraC family transcriptional regulator [Paenibacillus sp. LHD-117]
MGFGEAGFEAGAGASAGAGRLFKQEWLVGDQHPNVFAYYYKQWADYAMTYHTHDTVEIMYVISGECRIEFDSAPAFLPCAFTLRRGEFIVLDANVPHRLIVQDRGPCRMLNVEFSLQERNTAMPSLRLLAKEDPLVAELAAETSPLLVLRDNDELYPLLKSLVLELDAGDRRREARTQLLFAQLFVALAHIRNESLKLEDNPLNRYVKEAIQFIHHNYDRDIRVKDIAASVNLHPGYLHRVFRDGTGSTVTSYLNEVRMAKAKMLLSQTDIPVADICDYVGVGSRPYFHAMFKKHTGLTPIAYRQSFQTQNPRYD